MKKILLSISILTLCFIFVACTPSLESTDKKPDVNNSESFKIIYIQRNDLEIKIIKEKDKNLQPYTIYSYGGDVNIRINGKVLSLTDALDGNKITLEKILSKATTDRDEGIIRGDMYKDGGSQIYQYPNYTIIKCNTLEGIKDVYIGNPQMDINDIL